MEWKSNKEDGVYARLIDGTIISIEHIFNEELTENLYHIWIGDEFRYFEKKYKRLSNAIKAAEKYIRCK